MDNMNGMTPVGLVEGEFKVSTSSIPNYQTKRLGLTQYTPNRVTSWLGNYNDDMRKIDNFSSSIGAYVEKVIEDGDATHQELSRKITDTVSMIAAVERRVDENFTEHEEIRTNIQQVETGAAQKIVESEKRLVDMIQQNNTSTSSTLAYVQQQVTDNDAKHTLAESQLNQRVHVVEDEVAAIKENDTAFRSELNDVKSTVTTHTSSIAELEGDVAAAQGDATTANNRANENATEIDWLKTNLTAQDETLGTLQDRVGELENVGQVVNDLNSLPKIIFANYDSNMLRISANQIQSYRATTTNSLILEASPGTFDNTNKQITINLNLNVGLLKNCIVLIPFLRVSLPTGDPSKGNIKCGITINCSVSGSMDHNTRIFIQKLFLTTGGANSVNCNLKIYTPKELVILMAGDPAGQTADSHIFLL